MEKTKPKRLNTVQEKDIIKHLFSYNVNIYNTKTMKLKETRNYSNSFTIDEIYKDLQNKYPNDHKTIQIIINL